MPRAIEDLLGVGMASVFGDAQVIGRVIYGVIGDIPRVGQGFFDDECDFAGLRG